MIDLTVLTNNLKELCDFFERPALTGLALKVWITQLGTKLTEEQFLHAVETAIATLPRHHFPTCEQLIEFGRGSEALKQWIKIDRARRRVNPSQATLPQFQQLVNEAELDWAATQAIAAMGGLLVLSKVSDEQLNWARKEFVETYHSFDRSAEAIPARKEHETRLLEQQKEVLALPPATESAFNVENLQRLRDMIKASAKPMPQAEIVQETFEQRKDKAHAFLTQMKRDEESF